ncbi:MAG: flagellar export protein FliJ [Myxococcota bacterium]
MKSFRLSAVLRLRRHELDRAQGDLALAVREHADAQSALAEAESTASNARDEHWQQMRRGVDATTLRFSSAGVSDRVGAVDRATLQVRDASTRMQASRAQLLAASQRVRALERLELLHRERHQAEERRAEQRVLDEAGVARFARRRATSLVTALFLVIAPAAGLRAAPEDAPAVAAEEHAVTALLAEIRTKEARLERRTTELDDRERSIELLEQAAAERLVELERIAATVEERIEAWQADNGDTVRKLAKIYAAMPPARAAGLLEELEVGLATQVVAKMKDKQSAAVLSRISERRALAMSRRVAHPLGMEPASNRPTEER